MRSPLVLLAGAALSLSVLPANAVSDDEAQPVPAVANAWSASGDEAVPASDNVIVHWDSGVGRTARAQVRGDVNTEDFRNLGNARFQLLTLAEGQDPDLAVRELRANPDVASASRDRFSVLHATEPNDPLFNQLWGLDNKGLNVGGVGSSTIGDDISALDAWSRTVGGESVVVADLDDGIRPAHPDLKNRIWKNPGETPGDGIDNDGNGIVDDVIGADFAGANIDLEPIPFDNDPTDDIPQGGHGTHTAGTIAAEGDNGEGITGVAQKATIMPLRVCGWSPTYSGVYCPYSSQIAAINYAGAKGARVANMSLGGLSSGAGEPTVLDAFAANPNVLFVISAGNDANNNDGSVTTYPCAYDPSTTGKPGAIDNIVCVAASNQSDAKASFSSWGRTKVDIAAPGTEILSTYVTKDVFKEDFENPGFAFAGWSNNGGWKRDVGSPMSPFAMTNDTPTQAVSTTRSVTSPAIPVTAPTKCSLRFPRRLVSVGDTFGYQTFIDGVQSDARSSTAQGVALSGYDFSIAGSGVKNVTFQFNYARGASSPSTNGVWGDDIKLACHVPPGQEDGSSFAFLQGTSMAAPHVTGATALLAAYEPTATTMQLKQALLSSVDPVAAFNPDTGSFPISSGGRLNADKALSVVDALVVPDTTITSATSGTVATGDASFAFESDTKTPVTFECRVDGGGFSPCTSPHAISGLGDGQHTFDVRARDLSTAANADPSPASASWTVNAPVPPEQVQPIPPERVKPALAKPAKVTSVTVKRAKKAATIKWKAVPGATSYQVRVGKGTAKSTSGTSMKIKKLSPKKTFTVRIVAVNAAGPSPVVTVKVKKFKR